MRTLQLITISGIRDIKTMRVNKFSSTSYKLGGDLPNNIKWWGQVHSEDDKYTACFICPQCYSQFTEQIQKVLAGAITSCGCNH